LGISGFVILAGHSAIAHGHSRWLTAVVSRCCELDTGHVPHTTDPRAVADLLTPFTTQALTAPEVSVA